MREKYAFFSLAIHVAKLSRFARKSHEGALKKTGLSWKNLDCFEVYYHVYIHKELVYVHLLQL